MGPLCHMFNHNHKLSGCLCAVSLHKLAVLGSVFSVICRKISKFLPGQTLFLTMNFYFATTTIHPISRLAPSIVKWFTIARCSTCNFKHFMALFSLSKRVQTTANLAWISAALQLVPRLLVTLARFVDLWLFLWIKETRFLPESFILAENVHQQATFVVESAVNLTVLCLSCARRYAKRRYAIIVLLIFYCVFRSADLTSRPVPLKMALSRFDGRHFVLLDPQKRYAHFPNLEDVRMTF